MEPQQIKHTRVVLVSLDEDGAVFVRQNYNTPAERRGVADPFRLWLSKEEWISRLRPSVLVLTVEEVIL